MDLPVELAVEKELGITKEDIGSKISIEEYNKACRTNVMKYKDSWEDITCRNGILGRYGRSICNL